MLTTAENIYKKIKLYDLLTDAFRKNPVKIFLCVFYVY
jgi:hypothetical protein